MQAWISNTKLGPAFQQEIVTLHSKVENLILHAGPAAQFTLTLSLKEMWTVRKDWGWSTHCHVPVVSPHNSDTGQEVMASRQAEVSIAEHWAIWVQRKQDKMFPMMLLFRLMQGASDTWHICGRWLAAYALTKLPTTDPRLYKMLMHELQHQPSHSQLLAWMQGAYNFATNSLAVSRLERFCRLHPTSNRGIVCCWYCDIGNETWCRASFCIYFSHVND